MEDVRMTIRLPAVEIEFAKSYAREHGLTLADLVRRYFQLLQKSQQQEMPLEVSMIAGIIPPHIDARDEYYSDMLRPN